MSAPRSPMPPRAPMSASPVPMDGRSLINSGFNAVPQSGQHDPRMMGQMIGQMQPPGAMMQSGKGRNMPPPNFMQDDGMP
jgi:hypothetical protein